LAPAFPFPFFGGFGGSLNGSVSSTSSAPSMHTKQPHNISLYQAHVKTHKKAK